MSDFPATPGDFPPASIEGFLRFCAGEWMSLRSQLQLGIASDAAGEPDEHGEPVSDNPEERWHSSERGELVMHYLEREGPGGLEVAAKRDGALQAATRLLFEADGRFHGDDADASAGTWTLWPDGSLELVVDAGGLEVREKIWFTKPNLRLRSTIESRADGSPGRASFSSEIRRVSRPA